MIHLERVCEFTDSHGYLFMAVDIARWYDGDAEAGFDNFEPFRAVVTLVWHADVVELCGLHGEMTRPMRKFLELAMIERGATKAFALRHGRLVEWNLSNVDKRQEEST